MSKYRILAQLHAVKSNVALICHKVINLVTSEKFALAIGMLSGLAAWFYLATDHPVRFALAIIVATIALARVIVPMTKGGEARPLFAKYATVTMLLTSA